MFALIDHQPETQVQESEYWRLLGYPPGHKPGERARELSAWAREWYAQHGRPWVYARQTDSLSLSDGTLRIEELALTSRQLKEQWIEAGTKTAVLAAVSAGPECENKALELWQEGKPDEYFFLEIFGSAVVEHLITATGGRICAWAESQGVAALPHYSPGYTGWNLVDQPGLFELIQRQPNAGFDTRLRVLASGMLQPKKSLLAVFGITPNVDRVRQYARLIPCETCALMSCQYRRAPYMRALPGLDATRQLQPQAIHAAKPSRSGSDLPAKPPARYTINPRALKKWARERLQVMYLADGSVQTQFRFTGTTCSNLGRPLEFLYRVKLGRVNGDYRITEMDCAPAPGDSGHTFMCEYLKDAHGLMSAIAMEKPLLGSSLDEVLDWQRQASSAGCYCDWASRHHKWGLVLEVIHYTLSD